MTVDDRFNRPPAGFRWSVGNGPAEQAEREGLPGCPEFFQEARPRLVDPQLLALEPKTQVLLHFLPELSSGQGWGPASEVIEIIQAQIDRQASGFFTLGEVAHILTEANPGFQVRDLIERMMAAQLTTPLTKKLRRLPRDPGSKFGVRKEAKSFAFLWVVTPSDVDRWLADEEMPCRFPLEATAISKRTGSISTREDVWQLLAQQEAKKIIKRQALLGLYPPQMTIADEIAADFRTRKPPIHGDDGKPLTGATIKRHALKGISSATKKARTTNIDRGK